MIGEHAVTLIPDPDVESWGPDLASNPFLTNNLDGWQNFPFSSPWTWAAGQAVAPAVVTGGLAFIRNPAYPIVRGASTAFRARVTFTMPRAGWILLGCYFGRTATAASYGPFWSGEDAIEKTSWFNVATAGTFTFENVVNPGTVPLDFGFVAPVIQFVDSNTAAKIDSLQLQGQGAEQVDMTCLVDSVSLHYGRDDTTTQPEAATATLDVSLDTGDEALPDGLEIGSILRITTTTPETTSVRFVGRITDIALGWDDAGPDTPNALAGQIIAASPLSELGRRVVGDVPWPQELDGARVARIMSNAGITLDPTWSDPGTVQVIPRDVDAQAALPLAQEIAESASGIVWETRSGEVRYADSNHRRGATAALELDACDVLVTPTWNRSTSGLINKVSVGYGVAASEGDQPRYTAQNDTSIARYGRYELSTATQLAALADATALGQLLLVRNSSPVWVFSALPLDVKGLDALQTSALLGLNMHALISLTGLPSAGGAPTSAALWVEGWTERLAAGIHEIEIVVSGYCRTAPAPQWDDVDPALTWDAASGSWDDWTCIGPQPNRGRWADVPASLRWDRVAASISWDTWV